MTTDKILELFIKENMPEVKVPENMAKYFMSDIEKRGLLNESYLPLFDYKDGQKVRVRKEINSGTLVIAKGAVLTKNGDKYQVKNPHNPDEMFDIPASQVEGNGEFFEFPDGNGDFTTIENIIKMIPTPTV